MSHTICPGEDLDLRGVMLQLPGTYRDAEVPVGDVRVQVVVHGLGVDRDPRRRLLKGTHDERCSRSQRPIRPQDFWTESISNAHRRDPADPGWVRA